MESKVIDCKEFHIIKWDECLSYPLRTDEGGDSNWILLGLANCHFEFMQKGEGARRGFGLMCCILVLQGARKWWLHLSLHQVRHVYPRVWRTTVYVWFKYEWLEGQKLCLEVEQKEVPAVALSFIGQGAGLLALILKEKETIVAHLHMISPKRIHKVFLMEWRIRKPRKEPKVAIVQGKEALSATKQINLDIFTCNESPKVTHKKWGTAPG